MGKKGKLCELCTTRFNFDLVCNACDFRVDADLKKTIPPSMFAPKVMLAPRAMLAPKAFRAPKAGVDKPYPAMAGLCIPHFMKQRRPKTAKGAKYHVSTYGDAAEAFMSSTLPANDIAWEYGLDRATEFRCCECDATFTNNTVLKKHIRTHAPRKQFHCLPCGLDFTTKPELTRHLWSKTHRPVHCRGGAACNKRFKDVAGMLQHLESGACSSGLDRHAIDAIIRAHDTTNAIVTKLPASPPPPPSISAPAAVAAGWPTSLQIELTHEHDSDVEEIVYTPTASSPAQQACSRRSSYASSRKSSSQGGAMRFTPTTSGTATPTTGGILTPVFTTTTSTTSSHFELDQEPCLSEAAKTCPTCDKLFRTSNRLQHHFFSSVHALPIYHCPSDFLARELGIALETVGHGRKRKLDAPERTFKTLSALVQHIEAGSCVTGSAPGSDAWEKLIGFVESKIIGGIGHTAGSGSMLGL